MKPETAAFLRKSREFLDKAQGMLASDWPDEAGRAAYLAGLHAARAFLFERTGEITKTHKRVRAEFGRLTKDDPRFDPELRAFLGRAYDLKVIADYETDPDSNVTTDRAAAAIRMAHLFVEWISTRIPPNNDLPPAGGSV